MSVIDQDLAQVAPALKTMPDALGAATLAELMRRVEADPDLAPTQRRDLLSSLRAVARGIDQPAAAIPTDVASLRRLIGRALPAAAGLSPKRWRNARSALAHVIRRYQDGRLRQWQAPHLSGVWRDLRDALADDAARIGLSRLFRFLADREIAPAAVNAGTFTDFRHWLATRTLCADPEGVHRRSLRLWNRAAEGGAHWPRVDVEMPSRRQDFVLPLDAFPPSIAADLAAWQSAVGGGNLFDERAPARPLRPRTVAHETMVLRRFASALVHRGVDPAEIRNLADLVQPDRFKLALRYLLDRRGGRLTPGLASMASVVVAVARHWVRADADTVRALKRLAGRVSCSSPGLTAENRRRLAQFDDRRNVARLLHLPHRLVDLALVLGDARRAALLVQVALAISILTYAPLRLRNLAGLELGRHVVRHGRGRRQEVRLTIEREETKNRQVLDYPLPDVTARVLDLYLARYRPLLAAEGTWLFPGRDGGAKHDNLLSAQIQHAIRQHTGLVVHTHLFRHLAGKLSLLLDPGNYEQVRRLLGHKSIDTTTLYYTGFATDAAARRYHERVLQLGEGAAPSRPRKRR